MRARLLSSYLLVYYLSYVQIQQNQRINDYQNKQDNQNCKYSFIFSKFFKVGGVHFYDPPQVKICIAAVIRLSLQTDKKNGK